MAASGVGFILLDASLRILYANSEAIRIFAYPAAPIARRALHGYVANKIAAQLRSCQPSPAQPALTELSLGRRRYLCRCFALDQQSGGCFTTGAFEPRLAALIERSNRAFVQLAQAGDQYELTPREREAMGFLLHGLTSKQIAVQMRVSPNTVKAFLHSIMVKMRVRTRAGMVGKVLTNVRLSAAASAWSLPRALGVPVRPTTRLVRELDQ